MPGQVPPVRDEREGLLAFLAQQRYALRLTAFGLTDDQARATPAESPLSVGGLIKHVASTEAYWMGLVVGREIDPAVQQAAYETGFELGPGESLAGVLDAYEGVAAETEAIVAGIADLGRPVPVPPGVPWFPDDVDAWSVRWVLLHLISETARHAGHGDLVREAVDGGTAFPIMAAAEGWPASPWLQPWKPAPG